MTRKWTVWFLALELILAGSAPARQSAPRASASSREVGPPASLVAPPVAEDYTVGPGDVLDITIEDMPEASGKFRVSGLGEVVLPGLSAPVKAAGLTAPELSRRIGQALRQAELLRHPVVNVFVEEYRSRTVTVLGAVQKPSVYPLERATTVLEAISLAGGLLPTAGRHLTLVRRAPRGAAPAALKTSTETPARVFDLDLGKLLSGEDPALNLEVQAGDVLTVSTAPLIYVVGAVQKPGGFVLADPYASITVLQGLALAGGLTPVAAAGRSVIVRHAANGSNRREIPVDVQKLMAGKVDDQPLEPDDILFVPESGARRGARRLAEAAVQAATGVIIYGVGYGIVR
jgi:polysaccharide export outer membrane protein